MEAVLSPSTEVWGSYRVMVQVGKTISRPLRMDVRCFSAACCCLLKAQRVLRRPALPSQPYLGRLARLSYNKCKLRANRDLTPTDATCSAWALKGFPQTRTAWTGIYPWVQSIVPRRVG
jgi:hypothetical protein